MTNGCIYLVTHKESGKKYVGQHLNEDPTKRWAQHVYGGIRRSKNLMFINALHKYGKEAFTWEVIMTCSHEALNNMEAYWAEQLSSYYSDTNDAGGVPGGYNVSWCGELTSRGIKRRPDTIAKLKARTSMARGDKNGRRLHPERYPTGDNHYSRIHPERMARGDKNGARLHPERLARGDKSGARLHPERLARGDKNGARLHPERMARGEKHGNSKLSPYKVRIIRILYMSGHKISHANLGAMFSVSAVSIRNIITRKTWDHVQ